MNNIDLESIFIDLLGHDDYGEDYRDRANAPKRRLPIDKRYAAFFYLVQRIKELGGKRDYFSPLVKRTICIRFIPKGLPAPKFKSWYDMSLVDLNLIINKIFPLDIFSLAMLNPEPTPVKCTDPKQIQESTKESTARKPKLTVEVLTTDDLKHPMPPISKREVSTEPELDRLLGLTKDDE